MDYLQSVFLDFGDTDSLHLLEKTLLFAGVWAVLGYLLYLLLTKLVFHKSDKIGREHLLRLNFLRTLIALQVCFAVYLFFLVKFVGLERFNFADWHFYVAVLPQLVVFLGIIILYYFFSEASISKLKRPV